MNGFILAGGKSSRMGRDKALLDWHGRPLVAHMVQVLETATDEVRVVGRDPLPDRVPGRGPLSGSLVSYERRSNRTNDVAGTVWVVHQLTTQHRQRGEQSNGWATVPVAAPASGGP